MSAIQEIVGLPFCPPLSFKMQLLLVKRAKRKGREAEEAKLKLFCSLVGLIITKLCLFYGVRPEFWGEAVRASYLGFEKTLSRFDEERGVKFNTFALNRLSPLTTAFLGWLASESMELKVPERELRVIRRFERYLAILAVSEGDIDFPWHVPYRAIKDFCEISGSDERKIESFVRSRRIVSLERLQDLAVLNNDEADPPEIDFVGSDIDERPVEEKVLEQLKKEAVQNVMDEGRLTKREKEILELRYGFNGYQPHTLQEIGSNMGVTRERVRQIEKEALAKMKPLFKEKYPRLCFGT